MNFELISFNYRSSLLYDAVHVYCRVWGREKEASTIFFRKYARMPDFVGYIASVDSKIVGTAFGTISQTGQWWHDKVAKHVGLNHKALKNAWVLTELAVLKDYRKHNIGSHLHDKVLSEQPYPNVLLSTGLDNMLARYFYENRNWTYLHRGCAFQKGRPLYCIMHKELNHDR